MLKPTEPHEYQALRAELPEGSRIFIGTSVFGDSVYCRKLEISEKTTEDEKQLEAMVNHTISAIGKAISRKFTDPVDVYMSVLATPNEGSSKVVVDFTVNVSSRVLSVAN